MSLTGLIGTSIRPVRVAERLGLFLRRDDSAEDSSVGSLPGSVIGWAGYLLLTQVNPRSREPTFGRPARSASPSANPPGVRNPAGSTPMRVLSAAVVSRMFSTITCSAVRPSISHGDRRKRNWMSSGFFASTLTWS